MPAGLAAGRGRHLLRARELVRRGALGRVVLCRVGEWKNGLAVIRYLVGGAPPVACEPRGTDGPIAILLGDRATLTVHADACRLYPSGGQPVEFRRAV
ncbi:MAG: hypothetical protein JST11_16770 [Acidobacteria bacterium]|nr:hypothetical protein [Acidobacteriota bacterium]